MEQATDGAETAAIDGLRSSWSENIFVSFCLRAPGYRLTLWCALGLLVGGAIQVPQLQLQLQLQAVNTNTYVIVTKCNKQKKKKTFVFVVGNHILMLRCTPDYICKSFVISWETCTDGFRVIFLSAAVAAVHGTNTCSSLVVRGSSQQIHQRRALYWLDSRHWCYGH